MKDVDLTGLVFERWTVLGIAAPDRHGKTMWRVACSCGSSERAVYQASLVRGLSKSCGCLRREVSSARMLALLSARRQARRAA